MSYEWPLDPQHLFTERYPQMLSSLPEADVQATRSRINDMWADRAGGWVFEWSELAKGYAQVGDHLRSSLAYGWAKFPTLADEPKRQAMRLQIEQYELAAPRFPVSFERRILDIAHQGSTIAVAAHLLARPDLPKNAPVLIASGGVDTWKMDLHALFTSVAMALPYRVLAFDIPGTGETNVALDPKAHQVIEGLVEAARQLGNGKVAHFGFSMGGYFSASTGLSGQVDASIVVGGPVDKAFLPREGFEFGMDHIVGNAIGFDAPPAPDELMRRSAQLSLRPLLDQETNCPMFVINGADDIHVPREDTLVFNGRRNTQAVLVPDTGHCAIANGKLGTVVLPAMIKWLAQQALTS